MARFCTNCGKELEEGMAFCTECGTKVEVDDVTVAATQTAAAAVSQAASQTVQQSVSPTPAVVYQQPVYQQPVYQQPVQQTTAAVLDETNQVVKTRKYFGLIFLYGIPVIGLLACIYMSIFPKNKNVKNFSRAMLIWAILGLILCILIWMGLKALADVLAQMLNELGGGQLSELKNLFGQLGELKDVFGQLGDLDIGTLESMGDLGNVDLEALKGLGDLDLGALEGLGDLDLGVLEDILNMLPSGGQ